MSSVPESPVEPITPPQPGAVQSYVESLFGGPTYEKDSNPSINATPSKIVDNDPDRVALVIWNLGAEDVYVAFDESVSSTKGNYLAKNGGFMGMDVTEDFTMVARELWAVAPTPSSTLYITEIRRYTLTGQ